MNKKIVQQWLNSTVQLVIRQIKDVLLVIKLVISVETALNPSKNEFVFHINHSLYFIYSLKIQFIKLNI